MHPYNHSYPNITHLINAVSNIISTNQRIRLYLCALALENLIQFLLAALQQSHHMHILL
jgi:hypothetical protein